MRSRKPLIALAGVLVPLVMGCGSRDQSRGLLIQVRVNEIQASNQTTKADAFNEFDDWIELYNAGKHDVHLEGYFITDNPDRPFKHRLPAEVVVPAKGFLLLWADARAVEEADGGEVEEPVDQGPLHLSFNLSEQGESVYLNDPNGNRVDGTDLEWQEGDYSYARYPDGSGAFAWCSAPTPGTSNGSQCVEPFQPTSDAAAGD